MDDYYELVGVDRAASRDEIDRKVREQLRLWQRRTANADLSRRQAAERRVEQLGQARTVLLDEEQRRQYDLQLTALRASEPVPEDAAGTAVDAAAETAVDRATATGTWLSQARGYLAANDHHSAAYAARATIRTTSHPPAEVWTILAQANTELGRLDDAVFEARRAVELAPDSLEAQLALGRVLERRREWREAYEVYRATRHAHPHAEELELGMARALAGSGRPAQAVSELERRFGTGPDRARHGSTLARGLVESAEVLIHPGAPAADRLIVARMLARAREASADPEIGRVADRLEQRLARVSAGVPYPAAAGGAVYSPPTNVLAVIALVFSLVGLVACLPAPVGAVMGHVARAQIRARGERGAGLALAAVIVGWLVTGFFFCIVIAVLGNG